MGNRVTKSYVAHDLLQLVDYLSHAGLTISYGLATRPYLVSSKGSAKAHGPLVNHGNSYGHCSVD